MENEIMYIKLDDIIPNRFQPRQVFDEKALQELADSIKQHGVIEPIIVRPISNKFEIVAGERRYKASALAGLTKIPAIVKVMDDKESSIVAFIENAQRRDVSAIEEARTTDRILKTNNMTQEELAKELGISQSTLANKLRLLSLPMEVQESLMKNEISERHARSLLSVKDEKKQLELLNKIKEKRMTVRELDSEIKMMNGNNEMNNNIGFNTNSDYMSFINSYTNNNVMNEGEEIKDIVTPIPSNIEINNNGVVPNIEEAGKAQDTGDFMNFLNNYDNTHPATPTVAETPAQPQDTGNFMNFLNNYDNSHPVTPTVTETPAQPQDTGDFMNFLNNYDNSHPVTPTVAETPAQPQDTGDFMNFLNNYDNSHPVTPTVAETPAQPQDTGDFMNFLNNYDNSHPVTPTVTETPAQPQDEINEMNNQDINYSSYLNNNNQESGVMLNSVNPPITSNFNANSYVEDNPNYVDVSKATVIDNVDIIINELKATIEKIKNQSKFKVDTDEINFDDIYQITIKIDKRETL